MLVGIDFDNTIICYDEIFHRAALDREYIPAVLPRNKQAVRDHMRSTGREDAWTELQGAIYGPRITEAAPFPGVLDALKRLRTAGIGTAIVSHKTKQPYAGPPHDLHAAARRWLTHHGLLAPETGLGSDNIYFELTKEAKIRRIGALRCDYFIDDLPEIFTEPSFPRAVRKILFDPWQVHGALSVPRIGSWHDLDGALKNG